ncbi:MAG: helix-turn-helix transcriptional regulator [Clostridia bacterium]|nr:helix-turn-helix transcriptional regulator [Clostridia bacterium]
MLLGEYHFDCPEDVIVFRDSLQDNAPCIFERPRNHESLFLVTNGTLLYQREGVWQIVETGQVGYIARGSIDVSSAYSCREVSYVAINFHFDRYSARPTPTLPFPVLCATDSAERYQAFFTQALYCFTSRGGGSNLICTGIVLQIIGLLLDELKVETRDAVQKQRLEKAVEYMKSHCADSELKIADAAALSGLSERGFRRAFARVYHRTPYAFLQEFRIEKAGILLTNTTKPMWEIAAQCGFSDVYSFGHCFKKHTGISPAHYRENLQFFMVPHRRS